MMYVPQIAEFLDNYQNNRVKYKNLEDFIPEFEKFILTLEMFPKRDFTPRVLFKKLRRGRMQTLPFIGKILSIPFIMVTWIGSFLLSSTGKWSIKSTARRSFFPLGRHVWSGLRTTMRSFIPTDKKMSFRALRS